MTMNDANAATANSVPAARSSETIALLLMGSTDVVTASLQFLKPAPLRVSIPLFAGSSLMFFLFLYFVLPRLWDSVVSELFTFNVVLVLPMVLLLVASLVAYRLEGNDFQWSQFRDRFRLNSIDWHTWLWAIALAIFMYGGPYALPLSFALASAAVITERTGLSQRLKWLAGILGFTLASWVIWRCGSLLAVFLSTLNLFTFVISLATLVRMISWDFHYMAAGGLAFIIFWFCWSQMWESQEFGGAGVCARDRNFLTVRQRG